MEEKKKNPFGLIILIVLFVILLCGGSFYLGGILLNNSNKGLSNNNSTTSITGSTSSYVSKIDDSRDYVYTQSSQSFDYSFFSGGKTYTYKFSQPYINIKSSYADTINELLEYKYNSYVKDMQAFISNSDSYTGDSPSYMMYKSYENNGILSIIVWYCYEPDFFDVFNINLKTGYEATLSDMLYALNIDSSDFDANYYYNLALNNSDNSNASSDMLSQNFKYYIADNKFMLVGEFPTDAGQGYYYSIFDNEGNLISGYDLFDIES